MVDIQPSASSGSYTFDPDSLSVLNGLPTVHMSHKTLRSVLDTAATPSVSQSCEDTRMELRSGVTYEEFLQGEIQMWNYHDNHNIIISSVEQFFFKGSLTRLSLQSLSLYIIIMLLVMSKVI